MSAEPLPPHSAEDIESQLSHSAELLGLTLPELLAALHDVGEVAPELRVEAVRLLAGGTPDPGRRLRLVGRARKVSVSMPEDLTAAVQRRVGRGEFSHYVSEAVARQLESDLLGELSELLQEEHGSIPETALTEARNSWPDAQ